MIKDILFPTSRQEIQEFVDSISSPSRRLINGDAFQAKLKNDKKERLYVQIICEKHGEFEQFPMDHMKKDGCPKCSKNRHSITKEFIEKAQKVHNNSSFSFYFL